MTFKATVTPYSGIVGATITVTDERGMAAIVAVMVPDPTRDYRATADAIIKRLMVGFLSARERLDNIKNDWQMAERKIVTDYWPKPIPNRHFDWSATWNDYGGDQSPIGCGRTEQEAIDDLLCNTEERE